MRKGMLWPLIYLTFILFAASCGENLPESYGVFAYTDKGKVPLNGQKVLFVGSVFQPITGLRGSSGFRYNSVKHLIAFGKDINPKLIRLAKLEFRKWGVVSNPFGNTSIDVNLWIAVKSIGLDIAPIDGKKDMYKLTPKENLAQGFYALHFGGLENVSILEAAFGDVAFDFVVGDSSNYQSHEILEKRNDIGAGIDRGRGGHTACRTKVLIPSCVHSLTRVWTRVPLFRVPTSVGVAPARLRHTWNMPGVPVQAGGLSSWSPCSIFESNLVYVDLAYAGRMNVRRAVNET